MRGKLDMTRALFASAMMAGVLALGAGPASGAQARPPAPKVSEANAKTLREAQEALRAKKYSEAVAKSNAVIAGSNKTKDDVYVAYLFLFQVAQAQNDVPGEMKGLEGQINSGFLPPANEGELYRALTGLAYQQKDYHKAIDYGLQLIRGEDANPEIYQWVGQAYYELKDYKNAVRFFNSLVSEKEKRGRKPDRNELVLLQSAQLKDGDKAAAQATLEKIVRYYPDSTTWLALLYDVKRERLDPRQKLILYRLMDATGNLKLSQDFFGYAEAALAQGLPGESQKALDTGLKANAFPAGPDRDRAARYLKSAASRADAQRATLPKIEAEAKAAASGDKLVTLGATLFSLGQYDQAIDALKTALAKGGVQNVADVQATLGVAQLRNGQKAEALKTFRAADSDNDVTQRLLKLWAVYAS
jgi:tetratricopeptide (TPR) repeat protein